MEVQEEFCFVIPCYYDPYWRHRGDPPYRDTIEFDGKPPIWEGDAHALAGLQGILKHSGLTPEAAKTLEVAAKEITRVLQTQLPEGARVSVHD